MQLQAETLGTQLFATLNTAHVQYRGFFVERFVCCGSPLREYIVKPCVRGFSEIPTDAEFESGDVFLIMDDFNPGRGCLCLPGYFKRLTVNAKVYMSANPSSDLSLQLAAAWWTLPAQLLLPKVLQCYP